MNSNLEQGDVVASRRASLKVLRNWPRRIGWMAACSRYLELSRLLVGGVDKPYYQREAHDLVGLHPAVHYLECGRKAGVSLRPPLPLPATVGLSAKTSEGEKLQRALIFRPKKDDRLDAPSSCHVSVIMPCRNGSETVVSAVRSVLNQSYASRTLIFIDDGSSDDSVVRVEREFSSEIKSGEIVMLRGPAIGVSGARNMGLAQVISGWVAYLDCDNIWNSDHLSRHVEALLSTGTSWSYSGLSIKGEGDIGLQAYDRFELLQYNWIDLNAIVHAANLLPLVGGFDLRLRRLVDYDFALRLGRYGDPVQIDCPTVLYLRNPGGITSTEDFLPARARVRLSHICERISWGLAKPAVFTDNESFRDALVDIEKAGLITFSGDILEADLIVGSSVDATIGVPFIQICQSVSQIDITDSNTAVSILRRASVTHGLSDGLARLACAHVL